MSDSSTPQTQIVHGHAYPLLWFTSNTPITTGQRDCAMRRYLATHAGRHGTGYRKLQTAVPLATGGAVHTGAQLMGEWILDWQRTHTGQRLVEVPDAVIAWAASEAARQYEHGARTRGLELSHGDVDAAAANEQLILEQRSLIEGLVWVFGVARLPVMLASHRVLAVELEQTPVVDCTCGLGDWVGDHTQHAPRGCQGIVAQGRCDFLWERVDDGAVIYEELKTKASERKAWNDAWEHSGQLWLNMEGASRRLGVDVNAAHVTILYKGWRGKDRGADASVPKYQHSPLCYAYFDAGSPPVREPEWSSRYRWTDDYGKTHQLGRSFQRVPVWDEQYPLITAGQRAGASRMEVWMRAHLAQSQWPELLQVLGPFPRPVQRLVTADAGLRAEERLWRERVSVLRESQAYDTTHALVHEFIPRSWNCTGYDGTPCEFKPICHEEPGWESIETMGRYEMRRPHHAPEREAFEACGVTFPADAFESDGDAGGED